MNKSEILPRKRLGVAIPTYRRPDQLKRCLESVIRSAKHNCIPVYVLDDSGNSTNDAVISDLQSQYAFLHHIRNAENLGIDRNICKSVDSCETDYVWLLGEDDRMIPEAVSEMLPLLDKDPAFVFVNYATVNETVIVVLRDAALNVTEDCHMAAGDFLAEYGWAAGFIGGCVIERSSWLKVDRASYVGTYFAHIGTIFTAVAGRQILLKARPLVLNRVGSPETFTWRSSTFDVLNGWARLMDLMHAHYAEPVRKRSLETFEQAHGLNTLKFLLYARAGGVYDVALYERYIRPLNRIWVYHIAARCIASGNRNMMHMLHRIFGRLRHQRGRRISGY